ncbi:MAG: hypothetical protein ACI83D_000085 [Planctomycetota bacterium]|jgi:hypothetical protein
MSKLSHIIHELLSMLLLLVIIIGGGMLVYDQKDYAVAPPQAAAVGEVAVPDILLNIPPERLFVQPVPHIATPIPVRAAYMTAWVAGTTKARDAVISFIDNSEINAVIIDIKDDTGHVSFVTTDPVVMSIGSSKARIRDIHALIELLHSKGVYVIGRIAVFQDPYFANKFPDQAVQSISTDTVWRDRKGIAWVDAGSEMAWNYVASMAEHAYEIGFDEINFDYIRFPSDGNMKDVEYTLSAGKIRTDVMLSFYKYLDTRLRSQGIPISADLFGMTTSNRDDLGIGQVLTDALPHFDFIAPMIYPSHYPNGFLGLANPANNPYEVIHYAMKKGIERAELIGEDPAKLRPWIQDFDLGAKYDAAKIKAQKQALYDLGLYSWFTWDPRNKYTRGGYDKVLKLPETLTMPPVEDSNVPESELITTEI